MDRSRRIATDPVTTRPVGTDPALSSRLRLTAIPTALAALPLLSRTASGQGGPVMPVSGSTATPAANPATPLATLPTTPWPEMVEAMWASIRTAFYHPDIALYLERTPRRDNEIATLWPICALLSGLNARAAAGTAPEAAADLAVLADYLGEYLDTGADPPGYDSYPRSRGGGDKYYDDNEWLGIDGVYAFRQTGKQRYLDLATTTWRFAISGWSDDLGGGIYWKQYDPSTKNTCSNGPAAVLAMLLFEETGDAQYLDWATRIMDWTRQLRDPATGVYWDHLRADGTIDDRTFTYNTGTPLHACALLFRATGDGRYLDEARSLAAAAQDWFAPAASATEATAGVRVWPADPWFNSILFRGYVALAEVSPEPDADLDYVRAMLEFTRLGWGQARGEEGLLMPDWSQPAGGPALTHRLLDQAPLLEFAATAHRLGL